MRLLDLAAASSRLARIRNERIPRIAAICAVAVVAAIAAAVGVGWDGVVYADGGADGREQAMAADEGGATAQGYARRILRALADDDTNRWVRYWRARADCEEEAGEGTVAMERVLLELTGMVCARLDAILGVNPGDYLPGRGEERTVGLVASEPGAAVGYTLFTNKEINDVFLIDPLGRVAHAWHLDTPFNQAKLLDNGNLLATDPDVVFEFDSRGNIVWQYKIDDILHHDFLKMPNGNALLIVRGRKTREEAIAAGANPEFVHESGLEYEYLVEVRPTSASEGEVVWEWSAWDHIVQEFDPSKPNYGAVGEHPELIDINFLLETMSAHRPNDPATWRRRDWMHANTVDYNPELDQIMLSARNFSELWIIDHSATTEEARGHSGGNSGMGGDLLYRWGNPRAYGQGDAGDQRLFWQHQTHWIPPGLPGAGNILLFNNGNEFAGYKRYYSSIDEIIPPADGYRYRRADDAGYPPDEIEWTYAAETPEDFYAPLASGTQRLPNGNTLIVDWASGTISQATPGGKIVWKYVVPLNESAHLRQGEHAPVENIFPTAHGEVRSHANAVYRAYWHSLDHPGLQALDLTPGAYIEDLPDIYDRAYAAGAAALAGDFGERLADSDFDIYLDEGGAGDGRRLIYIKQPCAAEDTQPTFFLHVVPADARDLPAHMEGQGFDNRKFKFDGRGITHGDRCVAVRGLPNYPIERISTGQFTSAGVAWGAKVELGE